MLCCTWLCGCSDDDDKIVQANPPQLISIIPRAGYTGGTAIISGVFFSENAEENEVTINGVKAQVTAAAHNRLAIVLPENPDGEYSVKLTVKGQTVEGLTFRYAPAPAAPELEVLQLMPSVGYVGDVIKVIGQCFSTVAADNKVTINGTAAEVKEATANMLTIVVPDTKEGTYPVQVTVGDKTVNGPEFRYLHVVTLTTATLSPESGKPGQEIVITGEGFGEKPADNKVTINEVAAEVKAVTPTSLTIIAPENPAGTYPIVVTVGDKTVNNLTYTYVYEGYMVSTVAGSGAAATTDGKGLAAAIRSPQGIAFAPDGTLWIAQQNGNAIRKMDADFNVTTVNVTGGTLSAPWGCAFDKAGMFVVANKANNTVLKMTQDGTGTPITASSAYKGPMGVTYDAAGNLYISERDAKIVRKIAPDGAETTYAVGEKQGPCAAAVDAKGRIYVVNGADYKVYMISADGKVGTLFGTGVKPTADTWSDGKPGDLSEATMGQSFGISIASDGTMYITDLLAFVVRKLTPDANGDYDKGTLETIAGVPFTKGKADGAAAKATFNQLGGVAVAGDKIYVADNANHLIRVISK